MQRWRSAFFALCSSVLALAPSLGAGETLKIGGNGSGMAAMQILGAEFSRVAPGDSVIVVPNLGSSGGMKAVREGVIDLAISSRPAKPEEIAQGLVATEYGKTPFVFATSTSGADELKSLQDLVDAYSGKRATWADGKPIRLILRPRNDGDTALLQAMSPQMKQAVEIALSRPGMIVASTDQEAADALERTAGALGVTAMSMIQIEKRQLGILNINGVAPSRKAIADGSYPYVKTMYLVRPAGAKAVALRFQAFVASPQGRQLLQNAGYWVPGGS